MKKIYLLTFLTGMLFAACSQNQTHKTIGNTQDTTSVNKAGSGTTIGDTTTINQQRKDSAGNNAKSGASKGNADPSGRIKNQN